MSDFAVKFENVYKEYRLGAISGGVLCDDLWCYMDCICCKEESNKMLSDVRGTRLLCGVMMR